MKVVELSDVAVRFGAVRALDGVSLSLRAGTVTCLAGPNGAGKSTLTRVLLGLVRPDRGVLRIDGAVRAVDNAFKSALGYLPEAVAFSENLSGRQVLRFFASARGVARGRVDAVLETVGLAHAARRAVRGYSRGMRQRLGLGLAILSEPPLLILDEPTSGLDQEGLALLWRLIAEWRDAQRIVLMSSHELTLVEPRVDELCLLRSGEVCATGAPARLRERAALPVRVTFELAEAERAADFEAHLRRLSTSQRVRRGVNDLRVLVPPTELLATLDVHRLHPGAVRGVRVEEPGLDLVYEHLLGGNE